MGTPYFAVPTLNSLINSSHEVTAVFSQPPKPKGRGMDVTMSPVHNIAETYSIPIYTPSSLRIQETFEIINSIEADIIVVAAYGFIIPKNILESKQYGCINLHPSRLPRFRGAAPLQHTIIEGDKESSICVIQMDEGMDTGPILLQKDFTLPERPTLKWLHDYTAEEGAEMILEAIDNIDILTPRVQSNEGVVYATKLSKEDGFIDFGLSAEKIDAKIRGCAVWPGSFARSKGNIFKIIAAEPIDIQSDLPPGSIFESEKNMCVACVNGVLKILSIQPENKKPISGQDFLNGYTIQRFDSL